MMTYRKLNEVLCDSAQFDKNESNELNELYPDRGHSCGTKHRIKATQKMRAIIQALEKPVKKMKELGLEFSNTGRDNV